MSRVTELWLAGEAPAWGGIYWADGSARALDVGGARLPWFELGSVLDVEALLRENSNHVIELDVLGEIELADGSGYVCCGEGELGADGFFARLDSGRNLVWVVSLNDSNPFERLSVEGSTATFTNNLGSSITIDLTNPDFA